MDTNPNPESQVANHIFAIRDLNHIDDSNFELQITYSIMNRLNTLMTVTYMKFEKSKLKFQG